jgi:transposase
LTKEEEAEFLKPFLEVAPTGELCVAGSIKEALEEFLDHSIHHSTVYRMLHRNGWREIVPRPAHPEAKEQTLEAFKKTSPNS